MQFNDTTNKNGMIQRFEWWTRLPDGTVTGTLLKQVTAAINDGFDVIVPLLLSNTDFLRWDDTNHTDRPIATVDIVSGQGDYTIAEDDNSLDILNMTRVRILQNAAGTEYQDLIKMLVNDRRAVDAMSPNPSVSGIPTHYLEQGNTLYFYPKFNYAADDGIKLFFEREPSYFADDDTTKEPGFPSTFHILPVLYAALDWVLINRSKDAATITRIEARILKIEQALTDMISLRNPTKGRMSVTQSRERGFGTNRYPARSGRIY